MFRFLHAADIHLDSPLRGLDRYDGAPVEEIRTATRSALKRMVALAIEEGVAFVLIAGDVYDGDWKDYNTALFFQNQMVRLREAEIPVFLVSGNHDAESRMSRRLNLPDNVREFPTKSPATERLESLDVAIHGQGFARRDVRDDLSAGYPDPLAGRFNIGLLHTSADGREGHEPYAPCSVDGLVSRGYDYWALGHVHEREVLHRDPWIVFPGVLQGRHIRETGAKGCSLVTVDDGRVVDVQHHPLDTIRWSHHLLEVEGYSSSDDALTALEAGLRDEIEAADERFLALRVTLRGECTFAAEFMSRQDSRTQEVRALANDAGGGRIWIEKVLWKLSTPGIDRAMVADDAIGGLIRHLDELSRGESGIEALGDVFSDLRKKLPHELSLDDDPLDFSDPEAWRNLLDDVRELLLPRLLREETES